MPKTQKIRRIGEPPTDLYNRRKTMDEKQLKQALLDLVLKSVEGYYILSNIADEIGLWSRFHHVDSTSSQIAIEHSARMLCKTAIAAGKKDELLEAIIERMP
jgi:hypothetical protein